MIYIVYCSIMFYVVQLLFDDQYNEFETCQEMRRRECEDGGGD